MFYVGQHVICTNTRRWPTPRQFGRYTPTLPVRGRIYTVRAVIPQGTFRKGTFEGTAEDGLHLVEIVNPPLNLGRRKVELAFRQSRFRPLRTTNIDIFTKMLEPVPVREPELVS